MPRACPHAYTLTGLLVEDLVEGAGESRRHAANTLAGVAVEMLVRATVQTLITAPTHALTGFNVQLLIWATQIC